MLEMANKEEKIEIPRFDNEDEERDFWATHDSADFIRDAEKVELEHIGETTTFSGTVEAIWIEKSSVAFDETWVLASRKDESTP